MIIRSEEIPLAAWSLLLSHRQEFLNNYLVQDLVTPNQQGTHEMRDEVFSSVGAQDMDTSGYQVSADLDDVEFYWENDQLDAFKRCFSTGHGYSHFTNSFDDMDMAGSAENRILFDEEKDNESSPPTTPISERPTRPTSLLRNRPFGIRKDKVPDYVYRIFSKGNTVFVF